MTSVSAKARFAGVLYITSSLIGYLRLIYIPNNLIVAGDATATANNIAAHESLFRWGMVSYLGAGVLFLFVTLALYRLLEPVDQSLATLMVLLGGVMVTPIFVVNTATDAGALALVRGADFLSVLDKPKRHAFAMLFLDLHHHLDLANAVFWGIWLIPFGLLVYKSGFLPPFLGIWLMLGCFGYLAFSVAGLVFPRYEDTVFAIGTPLRVGEMAFMLWVLVLGAKTPNLPSTSRLGEVKNGG